jgi:predicted lipid-binding transport protein (Tim44 family)
MVYGDLQFFDIIIFAAIAVFIIYRLRSVLGKRTGFQKKPIDQHFVKKQPKKEKEEVKIPHLKENEQKLEDVYKKVPSFEHKAFLEGAKKAFEIIITAFNKGDKDTLKTLVSPGVYKAFETAINGGSNNPKSQFYSLVIDGIDDAKVENGKITIGVNFISEQILSDNEEDIVKNKDTWVFEKPENSSGPVWTLVST